MAAQAVARAVNVAQIDPGKAHNPIAKLRLANPNHLPNQRLAHINDVPGPFDLAVAPHPPHPAKRPKASARRSRSRRWNDALAELLAVQAECAAWFAALPESLCESPTAEALQEMIDFDLEAIAAVQPPLGYGRD